ncbi:MAG TPA: LLM class flavin-dependent oxidoreductase [Acidimicrobiales bacterium]|nr:LLM class flavin-dependent oxidoreductase [Acidimicrobiales bacterium]
MRVGVSLRSAYMVTDVRVGARMMIERAKAASEAGLDSLFVGDHHVTGSPYYQNSPILGRLLAEWGDAPAGALYLLPMWHPVLVAEQVGTLASIAKGRFILQCAVGGGTAEFAGMAEDLRERAARFEASLEIVKRLLAGERVTMPSDSPWPIVECSTGPRPPDPVEVWIGGVAPKAIDRAARLGDAWLAGPEHGRLEAKGLLTTYMERCETHGKIPTAKAIRRDVHVGADDRDAARVADPIVGAGYRGFPPEAIVTGGPAGVAERFAELAEAGFTDVIVRHLAEDQSEVLRSFERLAEVRRLVAAL